MIHKARILKILSLFLVFPIFISFFLANEADAAGASLYLSPPAGTYSVGRIFSIAIEVDSGGQAINAAEGTLTFDPNKLNVVSISKSGSIFSLWTTEPTFSNSLGTISFGGGTPSNFEGTSGIIITINFQAKTAGTSNVDFSTGSVLAADFKGTNILASMISGNYIIQPAKLPLPEYTPPENAPAAPAISSPTHLDSEKWYSNDDPKFTWRVPQDVTGVKLLVDNNPITIPTVFYSEVISEKQLEDLDDGIWYFHVQLHNEFGWGGVSHFKFQIDTQPPNPFEIKVKEGKETINPRPTLLFDATDKTSGIDYFEVQIDKGSPIRVTEPEYRLPPQSTGKYLILVKATDKAGNSMLSTIMISIIPPAFIRIGETVIDYLTLAITLLSLIAVIIAGSLWFWRKIKKERKKLRKETTEAEKALYRAFGLLRKKIKEGIAELDGNPDLSEREKKISNDLKKTLDVSEKLIGKEIKDIEEELE
jgi:hypothetical protein